MTNVLELGDNGESKPMIHSGRGRKAFGTLQSPTYRSDRSTPVELSKKQ